MAVNNPWLTPFQRSFTDIKNKLIEAFKLKVPEVTNFSEGNIFVRLISVVAAVAEVLHYYIDNMARESFFITARKYSSLLKHAKMVDYPIKSANASSVDVTLYLSTGLPVALDINIPANVVFSSLDGPSFITKKPYKWAAGTYSIVIPVSQIEVIPDIDFGSVTSEDIVISLGDLGAGNLYCEGSLSLSSTLSGVITSWSLVDTFAYSRNTDHHVKVELDSNQEPIIKFGNGINGAKPTIGSLLTGTYAVTKGTSGNISADTITSVPSSISSQVSNVVCTNKSNASGGTNYEDFNSLKEHVPLHIRTLGVAITEEDYVAIAKLVPGVDKAYAVQKCGKSLSIYITPDGGGIASMELLELVQYKALTKKVLGTSISVLPASEALLYLNVSVTGKPSFKAIDISKQVVNSLINRFNYNNSDIGMPVRVSELYAFLESLSMVDYLTINNVYLKPVPIPYSNAVELKLDISITQVNQSVSYLLRYDSVLSRFEVININGLSSGEYIPYDSSTPVWKVLNLSGNNWSIRILPSTGSGYMNGDMWKITLLKNNVDQLSPELSIPLFKSSEQISLTIIEKV